MSFACMTPVDEDVELEDDVIVEDSEEEAPERDDSFLLVLRWMLEFGERGRSANSASVY